jgi:hypothetical protein
MTRERAEAIAAQQQAELQGLGAKDISISVREFGGDFCVEAAYTVDGDSPYFAPVTGESA